MVAPESYVDSNVFVYWLGGHPTFGKKAYEWIKKIEGSPRGKYVTSSLTLYETLIIIAGLTGKSLNDGTFVEEIVGAVAGIQNLTITPLAVRDETEAVNLMKEYNLDYEDALHLAAALRNNVKEIISNDRDFDKTPLKRVFL